MSSRIDLEVHWTTKSRALEAEQLFDRARETLGPNSVVGLVNCKDRRFEALKKGRFTDLGNAVYSPDHKIIIVKGQEVKTADGDLLVMGHMPEVHLPDYSSLESTLRQSCEIGGINIATTPYHGKSRIPQVLEENPSLWRYLDALEIKNANMSRKTNERALELYSRGMLHNVNLGAIGSSDAHRFADVGRAYFESATLPDLAEIDTSQKVVDVLREEVRQSEPSRVYGGRNYIGAAMHGAIIASLIGFSKLPKPMHGLPIVKQILSCKDKQALRS